MSGVSADFESNTNFLIRYNSSGDTSWVKQFGWMGGMSFPEVKSMIMDTANNLYICSNRTNQYFPAVYSYEVYKYNSAGVQIWNTGYPLGGSGGGAVGIASDNIYNIFIAGTHGSNSNLIKYSNSGIQQWVSSYTGPASGHYYVSSLTIDTAECIYLIGDIYTYGDTTSNNFLTVKYNPLGIKLWEIQYNHLNFSDIPVKILTDNNNVYAAGNSFSNTVPSDIVLIKYSQLVPITPISKNIPNQFSLSQNYPNPFNPSTKIKFDIPYSLFEGRRSGLTEVKVDVKLVIFDVLGQQVAELVNQGLSPGTYEVEWNAAGYPSGIYFYTLKTESFSQTKRMVLIK